MECMNWKDRQGNGKFRVNKWRILSLQSENLAEFRKNFYGLMSGNLVQNLETTFNQEFDNSVESL